jgi:nucleoid DNA-binding protein
MHDADPGVILRHPRNCRTMTKKDIVRRIADELGCSQMEAAPIVQKTLDAIINVLAEEGRVELRNFGVFEVKKRNPRKARDPRTGEQVMIGERMRVTFKPGRNVEERIATERSNSVNQGAVQDNISNWEEKP